MARNLNRFDRAGGRVQVTNGRSADSLRAELPSRGSNHRTDFIHNAISQAEEHQQFGDAHRLIIARDRKGKLVGALSMQYSDPEVTGSEHRSVHIDEVGSDGSVPGTGTRLAVEASRRAAAERLPVTGTYADQDAARFWSGMGWHHDPMDEGMSVSGWTPDEASEVAIRHGGSVRGR